MKKREGGTRRGFPLFCHVVPDRPLSPTNGLDVVQEHPTHIPHGGWGSMQESRSGRILTERTAQDVSGLLGSEGRTAGAAGERAACFLAMRTPRWLSPVIHWSCAGADPVGARRGGQCGVD